MPRNSTGGAQIGVDLRAARIPGSIDLVSYLVSAIALARAVCESSFMNARVDCGA